MTSDDWLMFFQFLWRARPRLPRLPLLTGWAVPFATGLAAIWVLVCPFMAFIGATGWAVVFGAAGVSLTAWCLLSVWDGRWQRLLRRGERARWTAGDVEWLESTGALLPGGRER